VGELVRRIQLVRTRTLDSAASTQRADRFQWPLALAFLLLTLEGVIGLPTVSRRGPAPESPSASSAPRGPPYRSAIPASLAALAGLLVLPSGCSTQHREVRRGTRFYEESKWSQAYLAFQNAIAAGAGPAADYDAGNALYRMHRYEESAQRYRTLAGDSAGLSAAALFNLGNSYARAAEEADQTTRDEPLRLAVAAFEGVLRMSPRDSAAKWNLELVLRKLGPEEGGGSPGRGRHADYGRGNMDDPGYEGNEEAAVGAMAGGGYGSAEGESAEELSEEQARRLLEAVEREQLKAHEGRPAGRGRPGGRDW
jgi:tetratricopeptide (TPR) repeat protein